MLRVTLTRKIVAGYALMLLTGALAAVLIYSTLASVSRSLAELTTVEQPLSEAAHEMQINTVVTGLGVFKYLETGNRRYLRRVRDDRADFERFDAQYQRLATTPTERRLANRVAVLFDRFVAVGERMIATKGAQRRLLDRTLRRLERAQASLDRAGPGAGASLEEADAHLLELGGRLGALLSAPSDLNEARVQASAARLRRDASRGASPLVARELRTIERLAMEATAGERELRRDTERFVALRERIDGDLDERVQAQRSRELAAAERAAVAADRGLRRLLVLLALAALLITAVAVVVTRHLSGRVRRLMEGTRAVAEGDLGHRIDRRGRDEVASLTDNFNRMVARLQATTVSKDALEASEGRLRESVSELSHEKQRAEVTLDSIGDGVIRTGTDGLVRYLNPKAEELTGWAHAEAYGQELDDVLRTIEESSGDSASDLVALCVRDGAPRSSAHTVLSAGLARGPRHGEFAAELSVAAVRDQSHPERPIVGVVLAFRDVSAQRELAAQLSYQATHDALTGLSNRVEFEQRVGRALTGATTEGERHVICYVDLDQFKVVNDTCGHIAGDMLLKELAVALDDEVRDTDTLARLGGDEFGVLLQHCPADEGLVVAEKLRRRVDELRFDYCGRAFSPAASIGVVPLTAQSGSLADVLSAADAACYAAKDGGRNRVQLYHDDDVRLARRQGEMRWVTKITEALAEDRFQLHFQRIVPIRPGLEPGEHHEVLVRMLDERGELVPPGQFIPAAERYGLMADIDHWVIANALELVAARHRHQPEGQLERYSINLSGASLGNEACLAFIRSQLASHPVPPEAFCFEVTETAAISQLGSAIEFMLELRALGCRFSLDDFGSGLSSFAYLKTLPVDFVKIDGAFVKDMAKDPIDHAMVEAINRVGQVMDIRTIAEFVESAEILELLGEIGVDYAQGYHIGRPGPAAETLTPAIATNGHGPPVGAAGTARGR